MEPAQEIMKLAQNIFFLYCRWFGSCKMGRTILSPTLMTRRKYFLKISKRFSSACFFFFAMSYFRGTAIGKSSVKYVFLRYEQILRVKKNWKCCVILARCKMLSQCFVSYSSSCIFQYYCIYFCQRPSFSPYWHCIFDDVTFASS